MCYISLMGDPTLRMRIVSPPTNVTVVKDSLDNVISWTSAVDTSIQGYHVYRAPSTNLNGFTRITSAPVATRSFRDTNAAAGAYRYMVRTVKLEQSTSRSYYNASQGIFARAVPTAVSRLRATYSEGNGRVPADLRRNWAPILHREDHKPLGHDCMVPADEHHPLRSNRQRPPGQYECGDLLSWEELTKKLIGLKHVEIRLFRNRERIA